MTTSAATLRELLAADAHARATATGPLLTLDDVAASGPATWDYTLPTLVRGGDADTFTATRLCAADAAFAKDFYAKYPLVRELDLDSLNIIVAGGAVGEVAARARWGPGRDVDLFLSGHATAADAVAATRELGERIVAAYVRRGTALVREAVQAVADANAAKPSARTAALGHILEGFDELVFAPGEDRFRHAPVRPDAITPKNWKAIWAGIPGASRSFRVPEVTAVRTGNSVTYSIESARALGLKKLKLQLILRHYARGTPEVLYGFDLAPSAVAFAFGRVYFTPLAAYAYRTRILPIDAGRHNALYPHRIRKYERRGFAPVMPGLDVGALARTNLEYGYPEVAALPHLPFAYTRVDGNRVRLKELIETHGRTTDYDVDEEAENGGFGLAYLNLANLLGGKPLVFHHNGPIHELHMAMGVPPHLELRMFLRLYERIERSAWNADEGLLRVRTLAKYLPTVDAAALAAGVAGAWAAGRAGATRLVRAAFAAARDDATKLWETHVRDADHTRLTLVTENPGGQDGPLTGSVYPLFESPAEWYGRYHLAPDDGDGGGGGGRGDGDAAE